MAPLKSAPILVQFLFLFFLFPIKSSSFPPKRGHKNAVFLFETGPKCRQRIGLKAIIDLSVLRGPFFVPFLVWGLWGEGGILGLDLLVFVLLVSFLFLFLSSSSCVFLLVHLFFFVSYASGGVFLFACKKCVCVCNRK